MLEDALQVGGDLLGVGPQLDAVAVAGTPDDFTGLLRDHAGCRHQPDLELREWALQQTAAAMNARRALAVIRLVT